MRLIAHRGNLNGPNPEMENSPTYINKALLLGYDVEIDLWVIDGELYLGHDAPKYLIEIDYLNSISNTSWIHCKNFNALDHLTLIKSELNYFWHESDSYTITSKGFVWTYPGKEIGSNSIVLDFSADSLKKDYKSYGLCSDYLL